MSLMIKRGSSGDLTEVAKGLRGPVGVRFSPTGRCIGFGAEVDGRGEGTFVVDPNSGELRKVSDVGIGAAWSPDGAFVAGAVRDGLGTDAHEWLVVLRVARGPARLLPVAARLGRCVPFEAGAAVGRGALESVRGRHNRQPRHDPLIVWAIGPTMTGPSLTSWAGSFALPLGLPDRLC
jgi:hypothetical protein